MLNKGVRGFAATACWQCAFAHRCIISSGKSIWNLSELCHEESRQASGYFRCAGVMHDVGLIFNCVNQILIVRDYSGDGTSCSPNRNFMLHGSSRLAGRRCEFLARHLKFLKVLSLILVFDVLQLHTKYSLNLRQWLIDRNVVRLEDCNFMDGGVYQFYAKAGDGAMQPPSEFKVSNSLSLYIFDGVLCGLYYTRPIYVMFSCVDHHDRTMGQHAFGSFQCLLALSGLFPRYWFGGRSWIPSLSYYLSRDPG